MLTGIDQRFDKAIRITYIFLRTHRGILNAVPQHDGTTISLLDTDIRKPPRQGIAVTIKLVVR
jgi:hypothetical protein